MDLCDSEKSYILLTHAHRNLHTVVVYRTRDNYL